MPLPPVLRERGRLPESGAARGGQLLFEVLDLPLQALVVTLQAVVAAAQAIGLVLQTLAVALAPRQLRAGPFDFLSSVWLLLLASITGGTRTLVGHTTVMPDCAQKYKYTIVESALLRVETRPLTPVNEYRNIYVVQRLRRVA